MKNTLFLSTIVLLAGALAACAITIPWETMDDYDGVYVVMRVTPDDADVRLNGRFIGAAYEYASSRMALRLASRENKVEFRKNGFRSTVIDLRDFSTRRITLKVDLARSAETASTPQDSEDRQAYEAKSEPLPPEPAEKPESGEMRFLTLVQLTVTPEEAALYIDNRFWGLSPAVGKTMFLRLPPGKYLFTAFKPQHAPFSKEITVPKQEKFDLAIALRK